MILPDVSERTFLGRTLRFSLELIGLDAPRRILRGPLRGKRWIARSSIHRCWLGYYEPSKLKAFSAAIDSGAVVYDLGANVGIYSLLASIVAGPEGRVFSFEPVLRNLSFLRRHLQLNEVTNCSIFNVAVSDFNGFANFDVGPNSMMGRIIQESEGASSVRAVTLDSLVASGAIPPPDVIKCDIEGGEYDALVGALSTLERYRPKIFLATHGPRAHDRCCKLLLGLNYKIDSLDGLPLSQTDEILAIALEGRHL